MTAPLDPSPMTRLFGQACNHVPVYLRRLSNARVLWLNRRAIPDDPQFAAFGCDEEAYGRHLLQSCAYEVDSSSPSPSPLPANRPTAERPIGFADRYGGAGIGHNGGSGRGICCNGYQIKGVGRTPLVSGLTKESHASGGAYLEECVRETIFSEVVAAKFPHGAIPTLAIIDTGLVQTWHMPIGQKHERRTLLIRPYFLRPAHFERAVGFVAGARKEGMQDHARVVQTFAVAVAMYGQSGLRAMFDNFWSMWARQLAYSFVHRLPPGNTTTSNISFDGRLVDFGAMCAVPSWANAATSFFHHPFQDQFGGIVKAIESLSYYFGRHCDPGVAEEGAIAEQIARANKAYQQTVSRELLCLCGVTANIADATATGENSDALWRVTTALFAHYQAEQIDMVVSVPVLRVPWDLQQVWGANVPRHLQPLRKVLAELVPPVARQAAVADCLARAEPRPLLYAPAMKATIFKALDCGPPCSQAEDMARVAALIDDYVKSSVRIPRNP